MSTRNRQGIKDEARRILSGNSGDTTKIQVESIINDITDSHVNKSDDIITTSNAASKTASDANYYTAARVEERITAGIGQSRPEVIDALNSTSTTNALSANQGRVLANTRGAADYDETQIYNKGRLVWFNNRLWRANSNGITGVFDPSLWSNPTLADSTPVTNYTYPNVNAVQRTLTEKLSQDTPVSLYDFGCVGDVRDVTISSLPDRTTIVSAPGTYTPADVGKTIWIWEGGLYNVREYAFANHKGVIQTVNGDGSTITIDDPFPTESRTTFTNNDNFFYDDITGKFNNWISTVSFLNNTQRFLGIKYRSDQGEAIEAIVATDDTVNFNRALNSGFSDILIPEGRFKIEAASGFTGTVNLRGLSPDKSILDSRFRVDNSLDVFNGFRSNHLINAIGNKTLLNQTTNSRTQVDEFPTLGGSRVFECRGNVDTLISVAVDGNVVTTGFTLDENVVTFSAPPGSAGSTITITYTDNNTYLLSNAISVGQGFIDVDVVDGIEENDVLFVSDYVNGSWIANRPVYKKGEYFLVTRIVGNRVFLGGQTFDSYDPFTVALFKISGNSSTFRDFQIIGPRESEIKGFLINVKYGRGVKFENVRMSNYRFSAVAVDLCYDTITNGCDINQVVDDRPLLALDILADGQTIGGDVGGDGTSYAFTVNSCQKFYAINNSIWTTRHSINLVATAEVNSVVNRQVIIANNTLASRRDRAIDMHGNVQHILIANNVVTGGAYIAGSNTIVRDNDMTWANLSVKAGPAIFYRELLDANHYVLDNVIRVQGSDVNSELFLATNFGEIFLPRGGRMVIEGNKFYDEITGGKNSGDRHLVIQRSVTSLLTDPAEKVEVYIDISRNEFTTNTPGTTANLSVTLTSSLNGNERDTFERVTFNGNKLNGYGISISGAKNVEVIGNTIRQSSVSGVNVLAPNATSERYIIKGNEIFDSGQSAIFIDSFNSASRVPLAIVCGNVCVDSNLVSGNIQVGLDRITDLVFKGNVIGSTTSSPTTVYRIDEVTNFFDFENTAFGNNRENTTITSNVTNINTEVSRQTHTFRVTDRNGFTIPADSDLQPLDLHYSLTNFNFTINLPDSPREGKTISFNTTNSLVASLNNGITINPNSGTTIEGANNYVINRFQGSVTLSYDADNSEWYIVREDFKVSRRFLSSNSVSLGTEDEIYNIGNSDLVFTIQDEYPDGKILLFSRDAVPENRNYRIQVDQPLQGDIRIDGGDFIDMPGRTVLRLRFDNGTRSWTRI